MASLNGLTIFVESEEFNHSADITTHSVESGIDITDNVARQPSELSISGKIVGEDSAEIQRKIRGFMENGTLVNYIGRNYITNNCYALITSFDTSHPNTVWGGCEFSMTIKEIRFAQNSYNNTNTTQRTKATQNKGLQQKKLNTASGTPVYHTVKKGDTVWGLVASSNAPYRSYGKSCDWVMENNEKAFSKKGDFRTLQVGSKIVVGYR